MWAINHQKRISKGDQVKESSMKIDPEFEVVLSGLPEFVFNSDTLALSRELMPVAEPPSKDIERTEFTIADGAVVVSVHRPREVTGLLPAVLWIHGGGMVIGNRHMDNAQLERWCRSFSCTCVSVEYRLAPEYPFPAPLEDCYAALLWMVKEAGQLQIDISRIGVGGKSAGGGLAAAVCLMARERSGPPLSFQILDCPMLDDRQSTPSSQLEGVPIWSRESNQFGWKCYLGEHYGGDDVSPMAAPAREIDLRDLPTAFLAVGTADGLRDEIVDYGTRLSQADVLVELHVYAGVPHGTGMFPGLAATDRINGILDDFVGRSMAFRPQR
jgi:acetyl esterase/lipase